MNFEQLQRRIARAEELLEGREQQVVAQWGKLRQTWHAGWTPARIVIAGLGLGFLSGRAEPVAALNSVAGKLGGARFLQMVSTVSALFTATQAQEATESAERAAAASDTGEADPQQTDPATPPPAYATPRHDETLRQAHQQAPLPAEAATELSERD